MEMIANQTKAFFQPSHIRKIDIANAVLLQTWPTNEQVGQIEI
ncbi:hypothetical protein CGRA01v4_10415 [Colletotrichum graminicola]|nr:hypothetical protein CGRA01v4_10415 [Colletotrichum graminicola]